VEHESSECHGRVNYYSELSVTSLNALADEWTFRIPSLEFTEVFGAKALPLFEAAARDQCPAEREEIGSCDDVGPEKHNWSIRREPGRWAVQARVTAFASYAEKVDWSARTFDYVVPIEFQGSDQLSFVRDVTSAIVSQAKPSVKDVLVSPKADAAAVITNEVLLWFSVEGSRMAAELGELAKIENEDVVLAEWVCGQEIKEWTRRLAHFSSAPK
jgi:hypothetical protein